MTEHTPEPIDHRKRMSDALRSALESSGDCRFTVSPGETVKERLLVERFAQLDRAKHRALRDMAKAQARWERALADLDEAGLVEVQLPDHEEAPMADRKAGRNRSRARVSIL